MVIGYLENKRQLKPLRIQAYHLRFWPWSLSGPSCTHRITRLLNNDFVCGITGVCALSPLSDRERLEPSRSVKACPNPATQPGRVCKKSETSLLLQVALCAKATDTDLPKAQELVWTSKGCGLKAKDASQTQKSHSARKHTHASARTRTHANAQSAEFTVSSLLPCCPC